MGKVFKNQGLLTIKLETKSANVSVAEVKKILYKKPDETKGFFTATAEGTKLVHTFSNAEIDQAGTWEFQAYIEVAGLKGYGEIIKQLFLTSIE